MSFLSICFFLLIPAWLSIAFFSGRIMSATYFFLYIFALLKGGFKFYESNANLYGGYNSYFMVALLGLTLLHLLYVYHDLHAIEEGDYLDYDFYANSIWDKILRVSMIVVLFAAVGKVIDIFYPFLNCDLIHPEENGFICNISMQNGRYVDHLFGWGAILFFVILGLWNLFAIRAYLKKVRSVKISDMMKALFDLKKEEKHYVFKDYKLNRMASFVNASFLAALFWTFAEFGNLDEMLPISSGFIIFYFILMTQASYLKVRYFLKRRPGNVSV